MTAATNMMRHDPTIALHQQHHQNIYVLSNNGRFASGANPPNNSPQHESSPHNDRSKELLDDRSRYNEMYQNLSGQQRRYGLLHDTAEPDGCDQYAAGEKLYERDAFRYDHSVNYGTKKNYDGDLDEARPQNQPFDHVYDSSNICKQNVDYECHDDIVHQFEEITPQPSWVLSSVPKEDVSYADEGFPVKKEQVALLQNEWEYDALARNDDGLSNVLLNISIGTDGNVKAPRGTTPKRKMFWDQEQNLPHDSTKVQNFPPVLTRSGDSSEISDSPALHGTQELLRRSRQKRLELAMIMKQQVLHHHEQNKTNDATTDENCGVNHMFTTNDVTSPQSQVTRQTGGSKSTGARGIGGSSMLTETENNPNRSSRRALIFQIARARMKNQGVGVTKQTKTHLLH